MTLCEKLMPGLRQNTPGQGHKASLLNTLACMQAFKICLAGKTLQLLLTCTPMFVIHTHTAGNEEVPNS